MTGCRNSTWRPARAVHHPIFTRLQRKEGSCSAPTRGVEPRLRGGSSGKILAQFWKVLSHRAGPMDRAAPGCSPGGEGGDGGDVEWHH